MQAIRIEVQFKIFGLALLVCVGNVASTGNKPEQVHLSYGVNRTEMVVTWTTLTKINSLPMVRYGLDPAILDQVAHAETSHFEEGATAFYVYRAIMSELNPATVYYYQVSHGTELSERFKFKSMPVGDKWNPSLVLYGDLGYVNQRSLPYLKSEVSSGMYDAIIHVGDFAYDLNDDNGQVGHNFMRSIEKIAALVPYMVCPGNHEEHSNFSHYDACFSMLGDADHHGEIPLSQRINNHFYSFDIGPAHFVFFSTEYYYYTNYGWEQIERQYRFLKSDLVKAYKNRNQRPWIIAIGHRPPYCLSVGEEVCNSRTLERADIRQGIHMHGNANSPRKFGLEELFYKYRVDLQFYGHEHFYARLLPIYQMKVRPGANRTNPYHNPKGPVHIITGSAGNKDNHSIFNPRMPEWVGSHHLDYGYTRLRFTSPQHIVLEQVSDDQGGKVIDRIDMVKDGTHPQWSD